MKVFGTVDMLHWALSDAVVQIHKHEKTKFLSFLESHKRHQGEGKKIVFTLSALGDISQTETGGKIHFTFDESPVLGLDIQYKPRTRAQENTLRGIERFIFWAENNHRPTTDEDLYWIHESLIEKFSPEAENPITGETEPMRTSDPRMTTKGLGILIDRALDELMGKDIPKEVMDSVGHDMKELWKAWYQWRYDQGDADPLFEDELEGLQWDDYIKRHSVCELTGDGDSTFDPLIRAHIVSGGASGTTYEESWNWLRIKQSLHVDQHSEGWIDTILKRFSHIKGKIERARQIAGKKPLSKPEGEQQYEFEIY